MLAQDRDGRGLALGGFHHAIVGEPTARIREHQPAVVPMHRERGDEHGDHQRNRHDARTEADQQQHAATEFRAHGQRRHQFRKRHPQAVAEPVHRPVEADKLVPTSLHHDRREDQPQQERRDTVERGGHPQGTVVGTCRCVQE